jgi:hypothetical protein
VLDVDGSGSSVVTDRTAKHQGAVAPASDRAFEGLWIAQLAERAGLFATRAVAHEALEQRMGDALASKSISAPSSFGRESISLPKPRESTAKTEDLRGGEPKPEPIDL